MNEWSLIIFTLALQIAAGGVAALALTERLGGGRAGYAALGLFAALGAAGLFFSLTHLGDMTGAYRALTHVSTSWLSREAWLALVFVGLTILCAFWARQGKTTACLLPLAALAGVLFVFASAAVYAESVMEKWTSICPYADFFAATLLTGPLLAACLRRDDGSGLCVLRALFSLGVILFVLNIGFFGSTPQAPLALVRLGLTALGLVAGLGALLAAAPARRAAVAGVVLLVLGEGAGRYMFFAA
ncbi:MAG: dimethyl sulfoxide reductase anchor subunit [Deltaproteobacteria bacterium]|jgi:anaerobic dimethyl sulfoxide reductase subunit C (anchor subunit)|nr:dimethyl sulfoxide reductase anchor subunit [Deltaproteobacteria bacterium]